MLTNPLLSLKFVIYVYVLIYVEIICVYTYKNLNLCYFVYKIFLYIKGIMMYYSVSQY